MSPPSAVEPRSDPQSAQHEALAGAEGEPAPREEQLRELGLAFRHTFRVLSRLRGRDTHLGGEELSHAQFELLIELRERGELSAGDLAAAARLTPATVTQMLDHLADSGHVERARSPTDRRVVVTRLTPKGANKIEAKRAAWQSRWEQALAGVDADDLRGATRVLQRLAAMFEQAPAAGSCEPRDTSAQAAASAGSKPS
ncbi:MAG TPA: MarR family transcriptional regulator [Solirubrobacteraceae bacterium]|jgi:DNA-binding MarR family transcriptional regulator|nr:MarR family transcriptional regulator [Solirubrobacteraceae bacterium]